MSSFLEWDIDVSDSENDMRVNSISNLNQGLKIYSCNRCNRRFRYRCNLQAHLRTHTGYRPYHCGYCDKRFRQLGHLQTHQRAMHTGERPFACPVKPCTARFHQQANLQVHIRKNAHEFPGVTPPPRRKMPRKPRTSKNLIAKEAAKLASELESASSIAVDINAPICKRQRCLLCQRCAAVFSTNHALAEHMALHVLLDEQESSETQYGCGELEPVRQVEIVSQSTDSALPVYGYSLKPLARPANAEPSMSSGSRNPSFRTRDPVLGPYISAEGFSPLMTPKASLFVATSTANANAGNRSGKKVVVVLKKSSITGGKFLTGPADFGYSTVKVETCRPQTPAAHESSSINPPLESLGFSPTTFTIAPSLSSRDLDAPGSSSLPAGCDAMLIDLSMPSADVQPPLMSDIYGFDGFGATSDPARAPSLMGGSLPVISTSPDFMWGQLM